MNRLGLDSKFSLGQFLEIPKDGFVSSLAYGSLTNDLDSASIHNIREELYNAREVQRLIITYDDEDCELEPADMGLGVSQVLPVVVGVHDKNFTLLSIEQPELHIHPAIQCNLADEFVNAMFHSGRSTRERESNRVLLLETHSEHLMLRLLRRIRETYENELPPGIKGLVRMIFLSYCSAIYRRRTYHPATCNRRRRLREVAQGILRRTSGRIVLMLYELQLILKL